MQFDLRKFIATGTQPYHAEFPCDLSAKDFAKIQSGIDTKSSFTVSTRKASNHRQIVRYFTPIDAAGQTWWAASALTKTDLNRNTLILVVIMVLLAIATVLIIIVISSRLLRKYIKPIDDVVTVASQRAGHARAYIICAGKNP